MNSISSHKTNLFKKVSDYIRLRDLSKIIHRLLIVLSSGIVIIFAISFIESFWYFSKSIRFASLLLLSILFIITLIFWLGNPLKNIFNSKSFKNISNAAGEIGEAFPNIKDKLLNALQLVHLYNSEKSHSLSDAAFEEIYKRVEHISFNRIIDFSGVKKAGLFFLFSLIISSIMFSSFSTIRNGAIRLLSYNTEYSKPLEFTLLTKSGNKKIKRGDDVSLVFESTGKVPKEINIAIKALSESEFGFNRIKADTNDNYNLEIRNAKQTILYYAFKGEIITDTFKVEVISPPVITNLSFEIKPPKYSNLPLRYEENDGNILALKGTSIVFSLKSSKRLSSAYRKYGEEKIDSLTVIENEIKGNIFVKDKDSYYFEIYDEDKNKNENPIEYEIELIPDNFPNINVTRPEKYSLIPNNDIVTINYSISDDFGFTKVLLKYSKNITEKNHSSDGFEVIPLNIDTKEIDQTVFYNWDISQLNLRENEEVIFYLEVYDNDEVNGPKSSKSEFYNLRVPTLEELFAEADQTQESVIQELTETLSEAENLQKDFQKIRDDLKQNDKEINWNEKDRIQESLKKFDEIAKKVDTIQSKLDEMRKKITENNLLSKETMEKYNELQDLMDELDSDGLKKALEEMQKSLENLLRENVQQSLENMSVNEEFFKKSIERTINLLKKIQIEQKTDEIIKRTERILEDLDKLEKATENAAGKDENTESDRITNDQKDVENQLNSLKREMDNLQSKMSEVNDMPITDMKELNQKFEEQKNEELTSETINQLKEKNLFDALKNQNKVSQNMNSMLNDMKNLQEKMQQKSQQAVMQNMLKSIENIIELSMEQESLSNEISQLRSRPKELPDKAQSQMEMMQSLDKILQQLGELSQKTFAITPEMGEALGSARRNMSQSISGMQSRNSQKSSFNQTEAMKNLNDAALLLQNSLQAMMQGGGQGGSMMSLMQQLQQMAQQQLGLNKMTQMMQQGKLTMQQQAQLQRLAQQQASIQKSLGELNQEARESGQSKKLSANLEKVVEEMKEVVSGLNTQKIDDDLIKKQEKILSNLLDAQRSINERDFEEKRESFTGKDYIINSPDELLLNDEQSQNILREELLKSIQQSYTKDYEDIIRKYFESLNEKSANN